MLYVSRVWTEAELLADHVVRVEARKIARSEKKLIQDKVV